MILTQINEKTPLESYKNCQKEREKKKLYTNRELLISDYWKPKQCVAEIDIGLI